MAEKKFSMDDYVDVAERINEFNKKYPDGSLQSTVTYREDIAGWFAEAKAYRTPDDPRPGMGHAFEPVPGKTPYTRDSEAMNAETSAWGRAIVALGFQTKKIASKNEVRNRQPNTPAKPKTDQAPAMRERIKELVLKADPKGETLLSAQILAAFEELGTTLEKATPEELTIVGADLKNWVEAGATGDFKVIPF